jgi:curved DNA-binding protein
MAGRKDFYKVLGVKENASAGDIKKSYRKLAREYHPDRNQGKKGAEERFKEVQEAYETLSDAKKRKQYEIERKGPFPGGFPRGGAQYYQTPDGRRIRVDPGGGFGNGGFGGSGIEDVISQIFGDRARSHASRPSPANLDRKKTIRISFSRMLEGGKVEAKIGDETLRIPFPKGVRDGYKVRLRGKGDSDQSGRRGDLLITFRIREQVRFRREEEDVHTDAKVSMMEAIFGTECSVRDPYGKTIKLKVPAGVQPGEILRVRKHGIETDEKKGDLLVHVVVELPRDLTEEQREILREAAKKADLL